MSELSGQLAASRPAVYLVFTVGLPGLGKSSLINKLRVQCQSLPVALETCVSDEVRSGVLAQEYADRKVSPDQLGQEQVFQIELESGPKIKEELNRQISAKLLKLKHTGSQICVFILDKNHCAASLVDFVRRQAEDVFPGVRLAKRVILPTLDRDPQGAFGPFAFDTVAVALVRSLGRKGHITMNHGSLHSLLSFVTCLQNHVADDFDAKFPAEEFVRVPADYYVRARAEEVAALTGLRDQYDRLRQVLEPLAKKKAHLSDHADFICATTGQLGSMSVFPDFDYQKATLFLQTVFQ